MPSVLVPLLIMKGKEWRFGKLRGLEQLDVTAWFMLMSGFTVAVAPAV